jgi:hypothetical protein
VQGYPTVLRDFSGGAGVPLDQEMEYLQRSLAHVILEAKCNVVSPLSFFCFHGISVLAHQEMHHCQQRNYFLKNQV